MNKSSVPESALSQHIAILGKTGSGKTTAAKVLVEPLLEQGRLVAVVDPTDAWWGLRSSRDGKGSGFKILVLGGDHGDLPLPANGGAAVARLLVEQRVSLIASTKHLTVGERTRWFIDFAGTISRINRSPLHLIVDEAHNFSPKGKIPDPDTGKMLHAMNTLASGGRSLGVRLMMLTQRPQKLHNDTLSSADTLIAMRMLAPHDRAAVKDWIDGAADPTIGKEVLGSLASLKRGEGWVWYPEGDFLKRMTFPHISTFDSSATPKDGHAMATPKGAAEIDLTEIREMMAEAVKEAAANDPKALRARIAELERDAAKPRGMAVDTTALDQARSDGYKAGYAEAMRPFTGILPILQTCIHDASSVRDRLATLRDGIDSAPIPNFKVGNVQQAAPVVKHSDQFAKLRKLPVSASSSGVRLPPGELAVLTACAQLGGVERDQLSVLTGYKRSSRDAYIQRLREKGLVEVNGQSLAATAPGIDALGPDYEPLPTGSALLEYWRSKLPDGERKTLDVVIGFYPHPAPRESINSTTGYKRSSRDAYLQRLKSRRLIEFVGRGEVKASDNLFG